jgi:hypothetical protein
VQTPGHLVQFYGDGDDALVSNVAEYLDRALCANGGAVVVATALHREALMRRLASGATAAIKSRRLIFKDAAETLDRIMEHGFPNAARFDAIVGGLMRELNVRCGGAPVHAFGEMVALLWSAGQYPSAIRLEQLWNGLQKNVSFGLYCAYAIDVMERDFDPQALHALLCAHSRLLPAAPPGFEAAMRRAIQEVIGIEPDDVRPRASDGSQAWGELPPAESLILWVRRHHRALAERVLWRARQYFTAEAISA